MQRDSVTCPACATRVTIFAIHLPGSDGDNRASTGTVFKKCPGCRKWSWMNPLPQGAT